VTAFEAIDAMNPAQIVSGLDSMIELNRSLVAKRYTFLKKLKHNGFERQRSPSKPADLDGKQIGYAGLGF
jgi:hypothetical protein